MAIIGFLTDTVNFLLQRLTNKKLGSPNLRVNYFNPGKNPVDQHTKHYLSIVLYANNLRQL